MSSTVMLSQAAAPSLADNGARDNSATSEPSVIDESLFNKTLNLLALRVPAPLCSRIMAALRPTSLLFTHSKLPTIVDEQPTLQQQQQEQQEQEQDSGAQRSRASSRRPQTKLVLLSPALDSPTAFPAQLASLVSEHSLTTTHHTVHITYQMHSLDQVLSTLLPAGVQPPSSFETVGHLAHVNLLPSHLPYRRLIGAAIISRSPGIRCVVNKLSAISDEYRVLPMEVIAGDENDTLTVVREHGCQFKFDYRLVYWNSRLATEHRRVVDLIQPHETVVDMFAGIGPFIIPAAKHYTGHTQQLLANDKNVHSYTALNDNITLNGVDGRVLTFNLDARDFIAAVKGRLRSAQLSHIDHIIMNLPATAITFLDTLRGIYQHITHNTTQQHQQTHEPTLRSTDELQSEQQKQTAVTAASHTVSMPCPVVHVYCFSNADDKVADVMSRIESTIQHTLSAPTVTTDMPRSNGSSGVTAAAEAESGAVAGSGSGSGGGSGRPLAAMDRKRKREEKQHTALLHSQRQTWNKPLLHFVRNVAPNKDMLCVSFRLPDKVAFATDNAAG